MMLILFSFVLLNFVLTVWTLRIVISISEELGVTAYGRDSETDDDRAELDNFAP